MSLKFYIGPSGSGKSTKMQAAILERMKLEPDRHFIVIVPDQFTMETQKQLVDKSENKGLMNVDILSFSRLAYRIFEEVGTKDLMLLDDTGKNLIIRKIAFDNADKLPYLGAHLKQQGYIHEIKSAISEFMQYGITEDKMDKLIEYCCDKPMLKKKMTDLGYIYKEFLSYIDNKFFTTEEKLEVLARELKKSELASGSIVVFDGFTGFTPVQNNVILSLMEMADEVWMSFSIDEDSFENGDSGKEKTDIFRLTLKSVKQMTELAKMAGISLATSECIFDEKTVRYRNNAALAHLERNIFRYPFDKFKHGDEKDLDAINIISARNPREELINAATIIRKLVEERGYEYRDFALVAGNTESYVTYAKEIFDMYDIPVFLDANKKLSLNPFAEYIKAGLLIINTNYSYESVIHFLRTGITDISYEDVDMFDNYIRARGIRGYKNYKDDFVRYADYMKEKNDKGEPVITNKSTDMLMKINGIRAKLMELLDAITKYKKNKEYSAKQLTEDIYAFVLANNTYEKLKEYEKTFAAKGDYVREKEYAQVYERIMNILEQMAGLIGEDKVSVQEYYQIFEAGLSEIKIGVLPPGVDVCAFGDIQRTRLNNVKCLIFMGVNDGVIPASSSNGGIISDIDREFIAMSDYELSPSPRQQMYIQKFYLYTLMTSPLEKLYLTYSKTDSEGKTLRPSYIIGNIKNMFMGLMEQEFDIHDPRNIYGRKDGLGYIADKLRDYSIYNFDAENSKNFIAVYEALKKCEETNIKKYTEAAFLVHEEDVLAKELVKALHGAVLHNTISRLEKYASCAYAHFLRYGLKLGEREEYSFDNPDIGNMYHRVLQRFGETLKSEGIKWSEIDDDRAKSIVSDIVHEESIKYGESILYSSARSEYMVNHLKRILEKTVLSAKYQLSKGAFVPAEFEMRFNHVLEPEELKVGLSDDEKISISGVIDRLDLYSENDKRLVKIVDYKSSDKEIDLVEVYKGLQLQLVVYLDSAIKELKSRHPKDEILPAAMFYYHVEDPILNKNASLDEEKINDAIKKELRVKGLIKADENIINKLDTSYNGSSDVIRVRTKASGEFYADSNVITGEDLDTVVDYAKKKIGMLGKEIFDGKISPNPCSLDSCKYCEFKGICDFDTKIKGFSYKEEPDVTKENVIERMKEDIDG